MPPLYPKCCSPVICALRALTRTLIGGGGLCVYSCIHVLPNELLFNQIQIEQFEKKSAGQNMNILIYTPPPPINFLVRALNRIRQLYHWSFHTAPLKIFLNDINEKEGLLFIDLFFILLRCKTTFFFKQKRRHVKFLPLL